MDCSNGYQNFYDYLVPCEISGSLPNKDDGDQLYHYEDYLFPNDIWISKPLWEIATKGIALLPIVVFGLYGNVTLFQLILRNRHLKTPTNILIVNMAATDFVTLLISPWMFLCRDSFQNYILGAFACKIEGFFEFFFLLASVFNLVAVSYNRLTAIVLPREAKLTEKGAVIVIITVWCLGFLVAAPLIVFRTFVTREWANFTEEFCSEDSKVLPIYWNVIIGLMIWIPLAVMLICYSVIFHKLDKYEREVLKREHPIAVNYKKRVAKMFFIGVIVFVALRVPFTAVIIWRSKLLRNPGKDTIGEAFTILWFTCHYLMFTNAAVNPILYGLTNESFKRAYGQTSCGKLCISPPKERSKTSQPVRRIFVLQPRGPLAENNKRKWMKLPNVKSPTSKSKGTFNLCSTKINDGLKDYKDVVKDTNNYI